MLTYFQFLLLSLREKECYLHKKGIFLLSHTHDKGVIHLYAVGDFFVELCFNELQNRTTEVLGFKSLNRLQQHAEYIDLAQLIHT